MVDARILTLLGYFVNSVMLKSLYLIVPFGEIFKALDAGEIEELELDDNAEIELANIIHDVEKK